MQSVTEPELQAAAVAPRVTAQHIQDTIASEHYFTALEGALMAEGHTDGAAYAVKDNKSLSLLTFCVLVLKNGFTVTGESACASPENFNPDIGRRLAREHAVSKIWPLEGYVLRNKLAGAA